MYKRIIYIHPGYKVKLGRQLIVIVYMIRLVVCDGK